MPRWFAFVAYPTWFSLVFFLSVYLTFPLDQLKPMAVEFVEVKVLGRDSSIKVGRHGTNPEFSLGKLSPWRVSGGQATRVHLQLASKNADPGLALDFDAVHIRVGLLSLLSDELEIIFDLDLYDGNASGVLHLAKDDLFSGKSSGTTLRALEIEINGVKLDRFGPLLQKLGVPATGTIDGTIELALGLDPQKDAEGNIDLALSRVTLGPGEMKVYGPITTEIPLIDVGKLQAKLPISKGRGQTEVFALTGRDAAANAELEIVFSKRLASSRLNGSGWFKIADKFLSDNPKFKGALGFLPGVDKAKDKDEQIHFALAGTLQNLRPTLSKDGGKTKGGSKSRSRRGRRKNKKK